MKLPPQREGRRGRGKGGERRRKAEAEGLRANGVTEKQARAHDEHRGRGQEALAADLLTAEDVARRRGGSKGKLEALPEGSPCPRALVDKVQSRYGGPRWAGDLPQRVEGCRWLWDRMTAALYTAGREGENDTHAARWWGGAALEVQRKEGRGHVDARIWKAESVSQLWQRLEYQRASQGGDSFSDVEPGDVVENERDLQAAVARQIAVLELWDILAALEEELHMYTGVDFHGKSSSLAAWWGGEWVKKERMWVLSSREGLGTDVTTTTGGIERWHLTLKQIFLNVLKACVRGRRLDFLIVVIVFFVVPFHRRSRSRVATQHRLQFGFHQEADPRPAGVGRGGVQVEDLDAPPMDLEGEGGEVPGAGGEEPPPAAVGPHPSALEQQVTAVALRLVEELQQGGRLGDCRAPKDVVAPLLPGLVTVARATQVPARPQGKGQAWPTPGRDVLRRNTPAFAAADTGSRERVKPNCEGARHRPSDGGRPYSPKGEVVRAIEILSKLGLTHKLPEGCIEVTEDGVAWKREEVLALLAETGLTVKAKGAEIRKVKVNMEKSHKGKAGKTSLRSGMTTGRKKKPKVPHLHAIAMYEAEVRQGLHGQGLRKAPGRKRKPARPAAAKERKTKKRGEGAQKILKGG